MSAEFPQKQQELFEGIVGLIAVGILSSMVFWMHVLTSDREDLERLFRTLNERRSFRVKGGAVPQVDPKLPPADSGILGPVVTPDNLTVTVSVGDPLFDEHFSLAHIKPKRLSRMQVRGELRPQKQHQPMRHQSHTRRWALWQSDATHALTPLIVQFIMGSGRSTSSKLVLSHETSSPAKTMLGPHKAFPE